MTVQTGVGAVMSDDVPWPVELTAIMIGCLLAIACLGLCHLCWWATRAEFCPVCLSPDEEGDGRGEPTYFNRRPSFRWCEYGFQPPPLPGPLRRVVARLRECGASTISRLQSIGSCCGGGGGRGGGEQQQSLLEAGMGRSDGSNGMTPKNSFKKAAKVGGWRGYLTFMSLTAWNGVVASVRCVPCMGAWSALRQRFSKLGGGGGGGRGGGGGGGRRGHGGGGGGGGGSSSGYASGGDEPPHTPGRSGRSPSGSPGGKSPGGGGSRSPSPPPRSELKASMAAGSSGGQASGGGGRSRATMGDFDLQMDAKRNAKYNCCTRLWADAMLLLHSTKSKNFQVARAFGSWHDICRRVNHRKQALRTSLHSLVYRQERMALHGWIETYEAKKAMLRKLRKGFATLTQSAERRALNTWHHMVVERLEKLAKIEKAMQRASPEGRAKLRVLLHLRDLLYRVQALRKGLKGFVNHAYIAAFNKWLEVHYSQQAKNGKIKAALARMSPEGRAMLKAIEKFQEIQRAAYAMRRAIRMFQMAGPMKAFRAWKTLQARRTQGMQSTVWLAAQRGHRVGALQELFEALEPAVVDELIRSTDEVGMTPLLWSAKRGFADVVEVLLAFGADAAAVIEAGDADGSTALHHASRKGHNDIVQLLINASAPVNAVNLDHSTPLHWAARKNNTGAIKMLLDRGADLEAKNKWGATALDNAKFADHMGSIALLATDAATRKAAETKLILENKLRPTEEERAAKLAELASDALARREANRERLITTQAAREEKEAATKEKAQLERRQRNADRALALFLAPVKSGGGSGSGGGPPGALPPAAGWVVGGGNEVQELERAIAEAKAAGNDALKGQPAERVRAAELRLQELRAENGGGGGGGGGRGGGPFGSPMGAAATLNSHRTPGSERKESEMERKLRRQKLAGMKQR